MKALFWDVAPLDVLARERYSISEELMMEHAALAIKNVIEAKFGSGSSILIATGSGNNGADGYALARLLNAYNVEIFEVLEAKSELCKLQKTRCEKCGIKFTSKTRTKYDVVVDAIFGSGLANTLDLELLEVLTALNKISAYKIACDFPSGLGKNRSPQQEVFKADLTLTMGAGKLALFSDTAKDFVGEVIFAPLGISEKLYLDGSTPDGYMLEANDLKLPIRSQTCSHKGTYGHVAVFVGNKEGAGILCGMSALSFGAGLVTLITKEKISAPVDLMVSDMAPQNTNTVCIGSGLGDVWDDEIVEISKAKASFVIDADMFYKPTIEEFLDKPCVLTPHPKEFASLLGGCGFGDFSTENVQQNRFELAKKFSEKYPQAVLVLKGANTIIVQNGVLYVCTLGSVSLAKGGSGDVLSGMIGSLLAQGFTLLESAKNGVLAHALASQNIKNNYAMTPSALIEKIKEL